MTAPTIAGTESETPAAAGYSRRDLAAWCLYDWGSSAVPAIVLTFIIPPYFAQAVAGDAETGTAQWASAMTVSALLIAVLSPFVGALADRGGTRRAWLAGCTAFAVAAIALMWFVRPLPDDAWLALGLVVLANLGFELGYVFYNSMLPGLVPRTMLGRASGWGWGLGYAGGLAVMAIAWFGLIAPEVPPLGLDADDQEPARAAAPLAALWFAVFALPLLLLVRDTAPPKGRGTVGGAFAELKRSTGLIRQRPSIGWFLLAHMLYIDGLNTLFAFGGIFAATAFGMELVEVLEFGLALNLTAGIGAALFAWVDDRIGGKRLLVGAIIALTLLAAALLMVETKTWFWILGLALGVFFGPIQSGSRSLMARLTPPDIRSQMFGLFSLSGKATAFLGPLLVGWITVAAGDQRWGMASILVLLVAGLVLLLKVRSEAP